MPKGRRNKLEDVWLYVDRSGGDDACWPWTGALGHGGYGHWGLTDDRGLRQGRAHRFAYEATNGPIPKGLVLLHSCDNRLCCNPSHLTPGTQAENNADMRAKGRAKEHTHGAQHGTYSGYQRHVMRAGGWTFPACEPCTEAKRAYERSRRGAGTPCPRPDSTDDPSLSSPNVSRGEPTDPSVDVGPQMTRQESEGSPC